jgi:hypothetical protein
LLSVTRLGRHQLQLPGLGTADDPVGQLQLVVDQVPQDPIERATTGKLGEHRVDDRTRLLIGLQLPPARLGPPALEQTLLEDVQFCFRHGPL